MIHIKVKPAEGIALSTHQILLALAEENLIAIVDDHEQIPLTCTDLLDEDGNVIGTLEIYETEED